MRAEPDDRDRPGTGDASTARLRETMGAAMRALADSSDLSLRTGDSPSLAGAQARLPAWMFEPRPGSIGALRGETDSLALRHQHHDRPLHLRLAPRGGASREIFDALERVRIEALGARRFAGVAKNLRDAAVARWHASDFARSPESLELSLREAVPMLARWHILGEEQPPDARALLQHQESSLDERVGPLVADLVHMVGDQRAYALVCRRLIAALALDDAERESIESSSVCEPDQAREDEHDTSEDSIDATMRDALGEFDHGLEARSDGDDGGTQASLEEASARIFVAQPTARGCSARDPRYRIWTGAFDEIVDPVDVCSAAELALLRRRLDADVAALAPAVHRLAMRLQRALLGRMSRSWDFDLDDGVLDTGRLARAVAARGSARAFKQESPSRLPASVVALLIDNSGSMRGRSIELAAITAEVLARTLERCAIKVEILGFTTASWKGGRAREHWLASGSPPMPGRLADLRHVVYKTADTPWRHARRGLALMLHPGLLKENVDGEALLWAHERLLARPESRRILLVLSDGAPADDSTLSANDASYLVRHLHHTIERIERCGAVEISAVGIRHDVGRYYRRAVTVVNAEELAGALIDRLARLFGTCPLSGAAAKHGD